MGQTVGQRPGIPIEHDGVRRQPLAARHVHRGDAAAGLSGMSLAVGISVCEAVRARGIERAQVKWPNDLQVDGAKLGGVLIEIASAGSDGSAVVIGLGLNLAMPPDHAPDQAWTDLHQLGIDVDPCTWASCMTEAIVAAVDRFDAEGLDAFHDRWDAIDALRGRGVEVQGAQSVSGTARGIDAHGALRVEHAGGMWLCRSGEVRVRAA